MVNRRHFFYGLLTLLVFVFWSGNSMAVPGSIKWKFPLDPNSNCSPAVASDGTVYVPTGNHLLAISRTGRLEWSFEAGDNICTPTVGENGKVYFQSQSNGIYALDRNGNHLWTYNPEAFWPAGDGLAVDKAGTIYASYGGGKLYAITSAGKTKWISTQAGSPPAISSSGTIYSTGPSSAPYFLFGLDINNGQPIIQSEEPIGSYTKPPVIGLNGEIYLSGEYHMDAFNADGTKLWQFQHKDNIVSKPVTGQDGTVYLYTIFAADHGYWYILHAINPENGTEKWKWESNRADNANLAVGNDGTIYLTLNCITAISQDGNMLWQAGCPDGKFQVPFSSHPVIGPDGTLYVISFDVEDGKTYLYAFRTSSTGPASSSWPMMGANAQHTHALPYTPSNNVFTNQSFDSSRIRRYTLTFSETVNVAVISAGSLDLRGTLKDSKGSILQTNASYTDSGKCLCSPSGQTERGHKQMNFMIRANLPPGSYIIEVRPQTLTTPVDGTFSLVFLKRPSNSAEFFSGLDALLSDGDVSNDYFDIYVKALYPEYYNDVNDIQANENYGHTICYRSVCKERQCKALSNFYLEHIVGKPYLYQDAYIRQNWMKFTDADKNCITDDDYVLQENGSLIFHGNQNFGSNVKARCGSGSYCLDPISGEVHRGSDCQVDSAVIRGDIFVQRFSTINHYGLVYDGNTAMDANIKSDGLLRKGLNNIDNRNTANWKVARPQ